MNNFKAILVGVLLVAAGVVYGLYQFDLVGFTLFFDGWWTLFIIIPSLFGIFEKKDRMGAVVGLVIGLAFLLAAQGVIEFELLGKLIVPFLLVLVGVAMIIRRAVEEKGCSQEEQKRMNERLADMSSNSKEYPKNLCVFGAEKQNSSNEVFRGGSFSAIFGGIDYDLREAIIEEDMVVNCNAIFGGVTLLVPSDLKVKVKSMSIFGGVSNEARGEDSDGSKILYVNAFCAFGGVEIK